MESGSGEGERAEADVVVRVVPGGRHTRCTSGNDDWEAGERSGTLCSKTGS